MALLFFSLFVIVGALYTYASTSINQLNEVMIKKQAEDGDPLFLKISKFAANKKRFQNRMQNGSRLAGIAAVSYAGYSITLLVRSNTDWFTGRQFLVALVLVAGSLLASVPMLVFGFFLPRQLAMADPMAAAKRMVPFIPFLNILAVPLSTIIRLFTSFFYHLFRLEEDMTERVTEEEIRMMVDISRKSGNIAISEKEMIENIFEFNDKTAEEIMTHRTRIIGLEMSCSLDEAIDLALSEHYSRFPVYDERIDDIVGVLHVKDLLKYLRSGSKDDFNVIELCRPPFFVPQSKTVDGLFNDMQLKHQSMAIIIDEYGGTAGIVSIEDIIEEIVGKLQDEYDEEPLDIVPMQDGSYLIQASASLSEVERAIPNIHISDEEDENYDTIAGLVLAQLDRIPGKLEYPEFIHDNYRIKVIAMREHRIEQIRLWVLDQTK